MHRLIGHAIVSADDRIADAAGRMPPALHNDRDWARFQAALDRSAIVVLGRASHETTANPKRRRRLVLSSRARGLEERRDGLWLNPADLSLDEALGLILPGGGVAAVVGGQAVFDLALATGFAEFRLARVQRARLESGRGLFSATERGVPAAEILAAGGLVEGSEEMLDPEADVTLTIWRRG